LHNLIKGMKKTQKIFIFLSLIAVTVISGCSGFNKILKSEDTDLVYDSAMEYYKRGDYARALQLFDKIIVMVKGTEKEEPLSYYYAQCYYNQKNYFLANYYFRSYHKKFPYSERAEECFFLAALCKYKESSTYSLDPTPTTEAISEIQSFINLYPNSERVEECNGYIDELRAKLEKKDYEIAMMYFRMSEYKAAIVCFENILQDFPDTKKREEIYFNIITSKYEYAKNSIFEKRAERYKEVVDFYYKFETTFPESIYLEKAKEYYNLAKKQI
jgi:outer membrane protein assembly factor BamD